MDKRVKKTKEALQKAYIVLVGKDPSKLPLVKDVCLQANVNKTTFYRHYEDIYDLDKDTMNSVASTFIGNADGLKRTSMTTEDILKWTVERAKNNSDAIEIFKNRFPELQAIMKKKLYKVLAALRPNFYTDTQAKFLSSGIVEVLSNYKHIDKNAISELAQLINLINNSIKEGR